MVVSAPLLDRLALPPGTHATSCGDLAIRGKEVRVAAFSVTALADYARIPEDRSGYRYPWPLVQWKPVRVDVRMCLRVRSSDISLAATCREVPETSRWDRF